MTPARVFRPDEVRHTEVLVIGAGAAGLSAALAAPGRRVTVLAKGGLGASSTARAQGGVAVAVGADDAPARHAADTLAVGGGLNDPQVVSAIVAEGPERLAWLLELGARLDRAPDGGLALGREAAHSRRRVVHADGDATGAELVRCLAAAAAARDGIVHEPDVLVLELVRLGERVVGAVAVRRDGRRMLYLAPAVVLAAGGLGQLYRRTTNPAGATGDGLALAARAGARMADLEFVQFHPTALDAGADPMPLLTEALRGEGALLLDDEGRRFMPAVHPDAELAPRDVVARAIWRQLADDRRVLLDARGLGERLAERFPTVLGLCREHGMDPRREPVPVAPAAHYHMGGVVVDGAGRTSLPGLWACGEAAVTGLHGANRLASNSLLEALVTGARTGEDVVRTIAPVPDAEAAVAAAAVPVAAEPWRDGPRSAAVVERLRRLSWERLGIERSGDGLRAALEELDRLAMALPAGVSEAANMVIAARLVATAALAREESRGAHFRVDHPHTDPGWERHLELVGGRLAPTHVAAASGR